MRAGPKTNFSKKEIVSKECTTGSDIIPAMLISSDGVILTPLCSHSVLTRGRPLVRHCRVTELPTGEATSNGGIRMEGGSVGREQCKIY